MNHEKMAVLNECGIDYAEGLNRFMNNEALFEKFLLKFPDDTSYQELTAALARGDCQAAFRAAHTLKGVAGNLSMKRLFEKVAAQTEQLRGGNLEAGQLMMEEIAPLYDRIVAAGKAE